MQSGGATVASDPSVFSVFSNESQPSTVHTAAVVVAVVDPPTSSPTPPPPQLERTATAGHVLGPGPRRFAPPDGRSTQAQVIRLDSQMQLSLREIQTRWQDRQDKLSARHGPNSSSVFCLSPQWHIRYLWFYARQSRIDGSWRFPVERAWRAEKKLNRRYVNLNVTCLKEQLQSKVCTMIKSRKCFS